METSKQSPQDELISCDVCMEEIPVSEAESEEATDYVIYFCGLDCYAAWKAQHTKDKPTV